MDTKIIDTEKEKILEVLQQEVRLGIILGLDYFNSLNLRQLAKFVQKTEPTTHTHIKKLLELGLIELDASMVNERGKFYKLSDIGLAILKSSELDIDKENTEFNEQTIELVGKGIRSMSLILSNIVNLIAENMIEDPQYYIERIKNKEETGFTLTSTLTDIRFKNKQQLEKFNNATANYLNTIEEIKEDSERTEKEDIDIEDNIQIISVLSIPLYKFTESL